MESELNEQWIVAIVSPRDIAVHPNFSQETCSAPQLLASRLKGWGSAVRDADKAISEFTDEEKQLLQSAQEAFLLGEASVAARASLGALASESTDPCLSTAATIFLVASLADADQYSEIFQRLEAGLARLTGLAGPEVAICRAMLGLQRALREEEVGHTEASTAAEALEIVRSIDTDGLPGLDLSLGVDWESAHTWHRVLSELESAAIAHLSSSASPMEVDIWAEWVRREGPRVQAEFVGAEVEGLEKYVDERFNLATKDPSITWGSGDVIEGPVLRSLMHKELVGRPSARHSRRTMGQIRLLRRDVHGPMDALRLLRQSQDDKVFARAAQFLKAHGPLDLVRVEAITVLTSRPPEWWRKVDFQALTHGAEFLDGNEASNGFDILAAYMRRHGQDGSRFDVEAKASAIGALAKRANRDDDLARLVHQLTVEGAIEDMSKDGYARALASVDWDKVGNTTKTLWTDWLNGSSKAQNFPALTLLLAAELGLSEEPGPSDLSLMTIAAMLNSDLRSTESQLREAQVQEFSRVLIDALGKEQSRARQGAFLFGGIDVADLAVLLAIRHTELMSLWEAVCEFVTDPAVPRESKNSALDRMSASPALIPAPIVVQLKDGFAGVSSSQSPSIRSGSTSGGPYPSGLRIGAATGIASESALLTGVLGLASDEAPALRVDAARILGLLVTDATHSVWGQPLLLLLCRDRDATVRAHAGFALAQAKFEDGDLADMWLAVILDLLQEGGVLVPLLTLRGLMRALSQGTSLSDPRLISVIQSVAESQLPTSARELAARVLESL